MPNGGQTFLFEDVGSLIFCDAISETQLLKYGIAGKIAMNTATLTVTRRMVPAILVDWDQGAQIGDLIGLDFPPEFCVFLTWLKCH